PINDSINGVTDAIRSKEYELRNELYFFILSSLGLRVPRVHLEARLVFENNTTKKREIRKLVEEKKIEGYDDPRLLTIKGLRRRGIDPEAIRRFVLRFGLSKTDAKVNIRMLLDENRKIIDKKARRLFAVIDPVEVEIEDGSETARIPFHPTENMGYRVYEIKGKVFVSKKDIEARKRGDVISLMNLYEIMIKETGDFIKAARVESKERHDPVQWVGENGVRVNLAFIGDLLKDGRFNEESIKNVAAVCEPSILGIDEGSIIQLERIGFFRLDSKESLSLISL
ncbi:MAG: glutamate--tRNA ligase family protein, partial [Candidatus Micrarchaeaceae archaeon]